MKYYRNLLSIVVMSTLAVSCCYGMDESAFDESNWITESSLGQSFLGEPSNRPNLNVSSLEQSSIHAPELEFITQSSLSQKEKFSFIKASEALIDQLPRLEQYQQLSHPRILVDSIEKNISLMKDFIETQNPSEEKTRLSILSQLQEAVKKPAAILPETIQNWINLVGGVVNRTLNPNKMMTSALQINEFMQNKEKEAEIKHNKLLLRKSKKLIDSISKQNWDNPTKIYVLQLLFWFVHQQKMSSDLQVQIIRALHNLGAKAPDIVHQRGAKPYPMLAHIVEELPEGLPLPLKNLFNQIEKELLENQQSNPRLAIEAYHQDIEDQKKFLADEPKMAQVADQTKTFRKTYGLINKSPKSEQSLQKELTKPERDPKEKIDPKLISPRTSFTLPELAGMKLQAEITPQELNRLLEQNQKFVAKRTEEKIDDRDIRAKFEASILKNQQEMEKLIKEQVERFSQKINSDTNIPTLDAIKKELVLYETYVSPENQGLLNFINTSIKNLNLLSMPVPDLSEQERQKQIDAALQAQTKAEIASMEKETVESKLAAYILNDTTKLQLDRQEPIDIEHFKQLASKIEELKYLRDLYPDNQQIQNMIQSYEQRMQDDADALINQIMDQKGLFVDVKTNEARKQIVAQYFPGELKGYYSKAAIKEIIRRGAEQLVPQEQLSLQQRICKLEQEINDQMRSFGFAILNNDETVATQLRTSIKSLSSKVMELLASALHNAPNDKAQINHLKLKILIAKTLNSYHEIEFRMIGENKEQISTSSINFLNNFTAIAESLVNPENATTELDPYDKFLIAHIVESPIFIQLFVKKEATYLPDGTSITLIPTNKIEEFESAYHIIKLTLYYKPKASFFVQPQTQQIVSPVTVPAEQIAPVAPAVQPVEQQPQLVIPPVVTQPAIQPPVPTTVQPPIQPAQQPEKPLEERMAPFALLGQGITYVVNTITSTIGTVWNWFASFFR